MFLKESTDRRETKVLQIGFHEQTPGKRPCLAEKCFTKGGTGQLPVAGLAEGWQASVPENFAIKILFKICPIEALLSYLGIEHALRLNECILC